MVPIADVVMVMVLATVMTMLEPVHVTVPIVAVPVTRF